ncbi:hypothetical protein FRUB_09765 [Fimbriiglobus ruber]|uniref:Uncharacterized protein n=1 Tax=Fimbriiglobus ruber TaxID=1908690 RepID=A0A225D1X0_9BACT|nr:hypothetical protein FRUB_09765 [Fimbriiglobus ruber]
MPGGQFALACPAFGAEKTGPTMQLAGPADYGIGCRPFD